jgi:hypothetical protein
MRSCATLLAVLLAAGVAHADNKPWAQGVAQKTQDEANALFADANTLFARQAHAAALEKYRAAIALWDHPLIRFNMAVTLIRLDRVLEAADELDQALRYGNTPFEADHYQQALDYKALLAGRVGTIEASCEQAGAHVLLDGKPWFDCPNTRKQRVLAGEHAVVGERDGYLTRSLRLVVTGGSTMREKLELVPLDSAVALEYPTRRWIPWTIAGGGAAIAVSGLAVLFAGRSQMDKFSNEFRMACPQGCSLSTQPLLADERSSAQLKGTVGVSMIVAGGAVAASGVVWAILNKPRRVMPTVEVTPSHGGASASVGWQF